MIEFASHLKISSHSFTMAMTDSGDRAWFGLAVVPVLPKRRPANGNEILSNVTLASAADEPHSEASIGNKIRMRRRIRKLSLQEVADASGISIGLISQIERGASTPSLRSLQQICGALSMPIAWLFEANSSSSDEVIVTRSSRRRLDLGRNGMMKELLSPDSVPEIQMIRILIQPKGFSGEKPYNAETGAKCGIVLSGTLGLELQGVTYTISTGDSFAFDATKMHRFWCVGTSPVELIWVVTPALY